MSNLNVRRHILLSVLFCFKRYTSDVRKRVEQADVTDSKANRIIGRLSTDCRWLPNLPSAERRRANKASRKAAKQELQNG